MTAQLQRWSVLVGGAGHHLSRQTLPPHTSLQSEEVMRSSSSKLSKSHLQQAIARRGRILSENLFTKPTQANSQSCVTYHSWRPREPFAIQSSNLKGKTLLQWEHRPRALTRESQVGNFSRSPGLAQGSRGSHLRTLHTRSQTVTLKSDKFKNENYPKCTFSSGLSRLSSHCQETLVVKQHK